MCGNPKAGQAPSSGDLIAVIHPVHSPQLNVTAQRRSRPSTNCLIRLSNRHAAMTTSDFLCEANAIATDFIKERIEVRIHKYGSLLHSPSGTVDPSTIRTNPVVHTFFIDSGFPTPLGTVVRTSVGCKLGFGTGEDGVVGRTVSVLDQGKTVIGEGIIGWG